MRKSGLSNPVDPIMTNVFKHIAQRNSGLSIPVYPIDPILTNVCNNKKWILLIHSTQLKINTDTKTTLQKITHIRFTSNHNVYIKQPKAINNILINKICQIGRTMIPMKPVVV